MREGGHRLARILHDLAAKVEPGIVPQELAKIAAAEVEKAGLQAVLRGFEGYNDVMCISVNQAIVHGVPSKEAFGEGDVVKLDLTVSYKGLVVDSALTVVASKDKPPADVTRLLEGTQKALEAGINAVKGAGTRVGDISAAVEDVLNRHKLGVVHDLVGHGVGYGIHEEPNIPNFGVVGTGPVLPAGATIAIEPMATLGDWRVNILKDGWTVVTRDGSLSAHFEHTVLVTEDSAEILTAL
jgi:methionyl aminopeptidase